MVVSSSLPEFKTVAKTFRCHREKILNGYKHGKTNATAEGPDNTIKLLKKNAYGYHSFERMRMRCLFTLGYYKLVKMQASIWQIDGDEGDPSKAE